jgi:hypothetical protein
VAKGLQGKDADLEPSPHLVFERMDETASEAMMDVGLKGIEHSLGAGIYLGKGFEMRVTQHFLFGRLGARDTFLGPAH